LDGGREVAVPGERSRSETIQDTQARVVTTNYRIASFTDFRRNCCGRFSTASFQNRISAAAGQLQLPPNGEVRAGANMPRLACGRRGRKAAERERERGGTVLQRCVGTATSVSLGECRFTCEHMYFVL
jgi:hypothetical protein